MSQLFAWGGQSTGVSALASFLPKNTQDQAPKSSCGLSKYIIHNWIHIPLGIPGCTKCKLTDRPTLWNLTTWKEHMRTWLLKKIIWAESCEYLNTMKNRTFWNPQYSNEIRKTEKNNYDFVKYKNKCNFKIYILFRKVFLSFSGWWTTLGIQFLPINTPMYIDNSLVHNFRRFKDSPEIQSQTLGEAPLIHTFVAKLLPVFMQ